MGQAVSSEEPAAEGTEAAPQWWECCGARSNKTARGQAKAVKAFEKDPPAPGTSTGSVIPPQSRVREDLDDSDIQKIAQKSSSRPALRAAAPASRPPPPPEDDPEEKVATETKEAGVGLLFNRGADNRGWAVKTSIKGSPAEASGQILEGDVLVSVDGRPVEEVPSLGELSNMLMGAEGVPIKLVFSRQGVASLKDVTLVRSTLWMGEDGRSIGKQAIRKFGTWEATRTDFRANADDHEQVCVVCAMDAVMDAMRGMYACRCKSLHS